MVEDKRHVLQKHNVVLQASSFEGWRTAPRPNYTTNTDLMFPYSEYPRDEPYEYQSVKLTKQDSSKILDFWGEGRIVEGNLVTGFCGAYNVNHQFQLVSNGADRGKKIPNRIPTPDYETVSVEKYVPDGCFRIITLMGAPITESTASEISRIISGDEHSLVVTYGILEDHAYITTLETKLDANEMVVSTDYSLPSPLNEITLEPPLAFQKIKAVISQATSHFIEESMSSCASILTSLNKRSTQSAKKGLASFFSQDLVKDSYKIFALGYKLKKTPDGVHVMEGYMNKNVVKIVQNDYRNVQFQSNWGSPAYLCAYGEVYSWQWAFFGTAYYTGENSEFSLVPAQYGLVFMIKANHGFESYLSTKGQVGNNSWEWAFFGTGRYVEGGEYLRLHPIHGGEEFMIEAHFGEPSYLCVDGRVSPWRQWQHAFFGSLNYFENNQKYNPGKVFTPIFNN